METKPLLYGLIGFFLGGLVVSVAATTIEKPSDEVSMSQMTTSLKGVEGDAYDKAFITHMIDHHQAAVDMAKLSPTRAKHQEIKNLSRDIISAQEQEISRMKQWQKTWGYTDENTPPNHQAH